MANSVGSGRQLFLSSTQGARHDAANSLNSDLVFDIRDPVTSNWDRIGRSSRTHVALVNAVIPMSFYAINTTNNTVTIIATGAGGEVVTRSIPPRTYTGTTLASALTAAFEGSAAAFVFEYSEPDLKLQYTSPAATAPWTIDFAQSSAAGVIGLSEDIADIPASTAVLFPNPVDVSGPRYIVFDTDLPIESSDASEATRGMLAVIPLNAPPGALLYYSPTPPQYMETTVDQLNRMRIRLTDENHNLIDFQGVRWSCQLSFV